MTERLTRPSLALLRYAPGDIPAAIATLFDCLFQEPHGNTDAQGMVAVTRDLLGMFATAGVSTERLRKAAKDAFDRAASLADRIDADPVFRAEMGGEMPGAPPAPGAKAEGAPIEAGDASGMELLLPEDFEDRDFVLDVGSDLALQLEQAHGWIKNSGRYLFLDLDAPTGILLIGPTGTGKTTAAHWLAAKCGKKLLIARHDALSSRFIGQNLKNLAAMIARSIEEDAVLLFDEVDSIARDRALAGPNEAHRVEMLNSFLEQLTILRKRHPSQVVLSATNLPEVLDPAYVRRVAFTITFGFPSEDARRELVAGLLHMVDLDEDAHALLIERSEGKSGDYLRSVAMTAARAAVDALPPEVLATIDEARARAEAEKHVLIADAAAPPAPSDLDVPDTVSPPALPAAPLVWQRPRITRALVTTALRTVKDVHPVKGKTRATPSGLQIVGG